MKNRLISWFNQTDDTPLVGIGSFENFRKYLFDRLLIISTIISLPGVMLVLALESTVFVYFGAFNTLAFWVAFYYYHRGRKKIAHAIVFVLIYFINSLLCTFIQPLPAIGLMQLTYFIISYFVRISIFGIWGRLIIPLVCLVISVSSFYWVEPWVTVEHEVVLNAYFFFVAITVQVVFLMLYHRYLDINRVDLKSQQEDLIVNLRHLKVIPWKYLFRKQEFVSSSKYAELFSCPEHNPNSKSIEKCLITKLPIGFQKIIRNAVSSPLEYRGFDFVYEQENQGEIFYYHLRGETFFDKHGEPEVLYGSIEDVSIRKKEEDKISFSQSLLATTLESRLTGLLIIDTKGIIKQFNSKFLEMWNLQNLDVSGKFLLEVIDAAPEKIVDPESFYSDIFRVPANSGQETFMEILFKNGKYLEVYSKPHLHKETVVGMLISFRDITEKKKAIYSLRNSEEKYRALFESSADGILLLDMGARKAIDCNPQILQLFEASRKEILEGNTLTFSPAYQPDGNLSAEKREYFFNIDINTPEIRRFEWQYRTKTGKCFDAEVMVSPFIFQGRSMAIHIIRDISVRKALMFALEEQNFQLEEKVQERTVHLQKINAELIRSNDDLEQFAYAASHDLKEPLRMVGNFVGLLARDYQNKLDDKAHRYITFATEGVKRMTEQMKGLLEFSLMGRSEMNLRKANLNEILAQNLLNISVYTEEKGAKVHLPESTIEFVCEPVMIGILFHNLISNAIKFNKNKVPQVWIRYEMAGSMIKILVEDNGIGIPEENQKKIFEIFKRLHRPNEFEGTGIGLAMCRKIVHRHGGQIWVESQSGKGSTFCFTLPFLKKTTKKKQLTAQVEK